METTASNLRAKPNGTTEPPYLSRGIPWPKKANAGNGQFLHQRREHNGGDAGKVGFVYATLKGIIMNYQVRPGERLHAHEFAERLRVSATPVREAFIKLHAEEFIALMPNRGFYSKALDVKEQISLHEFAFLVMIDAIRRNTAGFGELDLHDAREDVPGDGNTVTKDAVHRSLPEALRSEYLYRQITSLSRNREMIKVMGNFCDRTRYVRLLELEDAEQRSAIAAGTDALVSALRAHDANSATDHLLRLLEMKRSGLTMLVKEGNSRALMTDLP
jgi:DNA-binding GntR family transcriptional regulator